METGNWSSVIGPGEFTGPFGNYSAYFLEASYTA
jgi:hypothetical protein